MKRIASDPTMPSHPHPAGHYCTTLIGLTPKGGVRQ